MVYFYKNGVYQFVILCKDIFSKFTLFGVPFPKLKTFCGIFWVLPIDYSPLGILGY